MKNHSSLIWLSGLILALSLSLSCATDPPVDKAGESPDSGPKTTPIPQILGDSSNTAQNSNPAQPKTDDPQDPKVSAQSGDYSTPIIKRKTGQLELVLSERTIEAKRHLEKEDRCWVQAPEIRDDGSHSRIVVVDHPEALAFADAYGLTLRFFGPCPSTVNVLILSAHRYAETRYGEQVTITKIKESPKSKTGSDVESNLELSLRAAAATTFKERAYTSPFYAYAASRLLREQGDNVQGNTAEDFNREDLEGIMDIYTGMRSIEEAVQTKRGLGIRPDAKATLPVSELTAVELADHPWEEMIRELGGAPVIEPLAALVPQDVIYAHVHDLRDFIKLTKRFDSLLTPITRALEESPGVNQFTKRYEQQLLISQTGLAEEYGHLACDGVAFVIGDPMLREGTDISLIFAANDKSLLLTALAGYEQMAIGAGADIRTDTYTVGEHTVTWRHSADMAIRQHRLELDEALIISNSRAGIERILAVVDGAKPALKEAGDFRYMRTVYPFAKDAEELFVFIGDEMVRRVVSPAFKIGQARRTLARADLMAVNYSWLLHGWLEGHPPADLQEVIDAGNLTIDELKHSDQSPIAMDAMGAYSAWGRASYLRPVSELKVDKVSVAEAEAYEQFRLSYQNYWRTFIDPIAIQVKDRDGRLEIDGRMLPLISGTEYEDLQRLVGTGRTHGHLRDKGIAWTFALGQDAGLRRELNGLTQDILNKDLEFDWLGDWVEVGAGDYGRLFELMVLLEGIPSFRNYEIFSLDTAKVLADSPIYAAIHIKNKIGLGLALTALKAFTQDAAPGMISWQQVDPYNGVEIVKISENTTSHEHFQLFYANPGEVFVLSPNLQIIKEKIDEYKDGFSQPAGTPEGQSLVQLSFSPEGAIYRTMLGLFEEPIVRSTSSTLLAAEILAMSHVEGSPQNPNNPPTIASAQAGLAFLGYEVGSAHETALKIDDHYLVADELYGSLVNPSLAEVPLASSPVTQALSKIQKIDLSVSFEGEGNHHGLHVTTALVAPE